jgi:Cu/Ag efflux pump CusA
LAMQSPKLILGISLAGFITAMAILPGLGKVFLPEFQDRALVNAVTLFPGQSLEATNQSAITVMDALKDDQRFDSLQFRSGFAAGDPDVGGVNFGELDVQISAVGAIDREKTVAVLRQELDKVPGVASSVGGFISHRMDEILSGVRSAIAVKIYGPELDQLRTLGKQVQAAMASIPGITDLQLEPQVPVKQVQVKFDRDAAARYGLTIGDLAETIETGFSGRIVSQVLEKQQTFNLVVRLPDSFRQNPESIGNFLVDTPAGQKIPLFQVAKIEYGSGPSTINRDNVSRLIVVAANTSGRDLGAIIADVRANVQKISLPAGYYVQFGGQFQAQEQATQTLLFSGAVALVVIAVLIYFAVKSIAGTMMILLNLPLALIGGVISVAMSGGIISVASMVGFITLFGVATRNGLLLVENYNMRLAAGMSLKETIIEGSMERLVAILLTALTSALGMVPIVIGSGAGKEILQPLAIVVLGGLFTSTALTLLVLPALYSQFGRWIVSSQSR